MINPGVSFKTHHVHFDCQVSQHSAISRFALLLVGIAMLPIQHVVRGDSLGAHQWQSAFFFVGSCQFAIVFTTGLKWTAASSQTPSIFFRNRECGVRQNVSCHAAPPPQGRGSANICYSQSYLFYHLTVVASGDGLLCTESWLL